MSRCKPMKARKAQGGIRIALRMPLHFPRPGEYRATASEVGASDGPELHPASAGARW
jgi:hypothetical protein